MSEDRGFDWFDGLLWFIQVTLTLILALILLKWVWPYIPAL